MITIFKDRMVLRSGICGLVILLSSWYLYYAAQIVSRQFITVDDRLAPDLSLQVKDLLDKNISQNPEARFTELKSQVPVLEIFKVKRIGLDKDYVQVIASNPIYRLGKDFVLTSNNEVFLASNFNGSILQSLPEIFLHTKPESVTEIEDEQRFFLRQIPDFVISQYEIHWHNLNQIVLINKQNPKQHILVKYNQTLTPALFVIGEKLLTEYQAQTDKKCLEIMKVDLRFEKQVIVSC